MHSIINDLERVGDIYFQMSKTYETMREQELRLPPEAIKEIEEMLDLVLNCIRLVRENMKSYNGDIDLEKAIEIEKEINEKRDLLKSAHYSRLEKGDYHAKAGVMFLDFLSRLEKIGDHLFNVNEALAGKKIKAAYSKIVEG
jgi:phosphate:Na+ symporter